MVKGRPVVLAGLDIGTSKTVAVIAESVQGYPNLLGVGESPSVGLQKGVVTDPDLASKSIVQALEKAEKASGVKVESVYVSFNGVGINVRNCRLNLASGNCAFLYKEKGVVIPPNGFSAEIPRDEAVLQLIPTVKQYGSFEKEQKAKIITCKTKDLESIIESTRLAGLTVKRVIYGPLAAAEALLTPAEREFGTILVDIGAGSTSVSLFYKSLIVETTVFSIGGEHLLGDLAIGLRTSLVEAGKILTGFSLNSGGDDSLKPDSGKIYETGRDGREGADLVRLVVWARINEILNIVAQAIGGFNFSGLLPGGAVFCGGVSKMGGLIILAEEKLQMPVRTGRVETGGMELDPAVFNAFGLVKYGCAHLQGEEHRTKKHYKPGGLIGKFSNWFRDKTEKKEFI